VPKRKTRCTIIGFFNSAGICAFAPIAVAQVNCEAIPGGPARTDCYIGLARIGASNAAIAGTKSQLATDSGMPKREEEVTQEIRAAYELRNIPAA